MEICNGNLRNLILVLFLFYFFSLTFAKATNLTMEKGEVRIRYVGTPLAERKFADMCIIFEEKGYNNYLECDYYLQIKIKTQIPEHILEQIKNDEKLISLGINIKEFAEFIKSTVNYITSDPNIEEISLQLDDKYKIVDGYVKVGKKESSLHYIESSLFLSNGDIKVKRMEIKVYSKGYMVYRNVKIENFGKNNVSIKINENNLETFASSGSDINLSLNFYNYYSYHFFKIRSVSESEINIDATKGKESFTLERGNIIVTHIEKPIVGNMKREIITMKKIWILEMSRKLGANMQTGEIYGFYEKGNKTHAEVEIKDKYYNLASLKFPHVSETEIEREKIKIKINDVGIFTERVFIVRTLDDKQKVKELIKV
jgi:hypothetical protein